VEAGSNTTVVQHVVGDDEKETKRLVVFLNPLFLGDIDTGTCPSRLRDSVI
jgi:hypothetical protein